MHSTAKVSRLDFLPVWQQYRDPLLGMLSAQLCRSMLSYFHQDLKE